MRNWLKFSNQRSGAKNSVGTANADCAASPIRAAGAGSALGASSATGATSALSASSAQGATTAGIIMGTCSASGTKSEIGLNANDTIHATGA